MATINGLFLAILIFGGLLEKRIQRLEAVHEKLAQARLKELEEQEPPPMAEQRFTQGVENILNYALRFPGENPAPEGEE